MRWWVAYNPLCYEWGWVDAFAPHLRAFSLGPFTVCWYPRWTGLRYGK